MIISSPENIGFIRVQIYLIRIKAKSQNGINQCKNIDFVEFVDGGYMN